MSFVSHNGVTLHYRLAGAQDRPPLILINSLGTNLAIWDDMLPRLASRYRVLTYDKRGHGLSDSPRGPYGLDAMWETLSASPMPAASGTSRSAASRSAA